MLGRILISPFLERSMFVTVLYAIQSTLLRKKNLVKNFQTSMALCDTGAYSTAFHACNCINCVHNCENHNGNTVVEIRDDGDEN